MVAATAVLAVLIAGIAVFWDDVMRTGLDPKVPFQTYRPPAAPDYAQPSAWALLPPHPEAAQAGDPPADVFFLTPTTFEVL